MLTIDAAHLVIVTGGGEKAVAVMLRPETCLRDARDLAQMLPSSACLTLYTLDDVHASEWRYRKPARRRRYVGKAAE